MNVVVGNRLGLVDMRNIPRTLRKTPTPLRKAPRVLKENTWRVSPTDPVNYSPAAWQCKTCTKLKRLCDFNFKNMPVTDSHTYLPAVIIDCTEHVSGESI